MTMLWIGTYPSAGFGTPTGRGEGVWRVELDALDGMLGIPHQVVVTPAPSFVATHPDGRTVYAVDESSPGAVSSFAVRDGALVTTATVPSGGSAPCHLLLDAEAGLLYVANYADGVLGVLRLAADGTLADDEPAQRLPGDGHGPRADRQEGPHAHYVVMTPSRAHVLVMDLGADQVRRYARDVAGRRLVPAGVAATFPPGTGPRHLAFSPDGRFAYVTGELDASVHVLAWDVATDTGASVQVLPATAAPARPDAEVKPAHVLIDGEEVVVGVRGTEVLSRFTRHADGLLTHRADDALPGRTPRDHEVVDGWTVVAEQDSSALTVLDGDGGVVCTRSLPVPACVVPVVAPVVEPPVDPVGGTAAGTV